VTTVQLTNQMIAHMAKSYKELSKLMEMQKHVAVHMTQIMHAIPSEGMSFTGTDSISERAVDVKRNITSYLNTLAALEDAMADNLSCIFKEINPDEEE
jgi:hypothetical protein